MKNKSDNDITHTT